MNAQMNNGFIKDTEVLMYNGELKKIQDIEIGELVMSNNNSPLSVTNIKSDINELYKISHFNNDENYIVNKDFVLSLNYIHKKTINDQSNYYIISWFNNDTISAKSVKFFYNKKNKTKIYSNANIFYNNIKEDRQINIKVCDYMNLPLKMQKKLHGIKSLVIFSKKESIFDLYMMGNMEGMNIYGMVENTKISDKYKCASISERFKYLAGIIDGYGYVQYDKYILDIPEYNSYIKDLIFLIKSVGLNCIYKDNTLIIYGNQIFNIPTINVKLQCNLNKYSNKIEVSNHGIDTYYTLQFNKDSKYLLGTCIVV